MTALPAPVVTSFDPAVLAQLLDSHHPEVRERIREIIARPDFARRDHLPRPEYREQVLTWCQALAADGGSALGLPAEYGGGGDVGASVVAFETLAHGDLSLLVKVGVHFGLWGGAVLQLGTRTHHERYMADIVSMKLPGCFAMTESGHGSDVQSIGTTATYDEATQEFVVNTPDRLSYKDYIGNAAAHGLMAAVFAQLIVGGENHGVHALLVRIRNDDGTPMPGVTIEDDGEKIGLNGVDNGRLAFDNVRVQRDALLDKFAQVSEEGIYESPIENPNKRFFTMLGTLIQGRVCIAAGAASAAKNALAIAVRYGEKRRQFGPPGGDGPETRLLDYLSHQRRLLPLLARTYALHFTQQRLSSDLHRAFTTPEDLDDQMRRELETNAAGIKAISTWHATETIQACREACGGAGYLAENRFAALKADTDVFTTFEGDNTVLLQLVGKARLTNFEHEFGDLDPLGLVGFVASQVFETVLEKTGVRSVRDALRDVNPLRDDDDDFDVHSRDWQLDILRFREEHIVSGVARRLRGGVDAGHPAYDVFIACQDHVIQAARAHVDRVIADDFAKSIDGVEDTSLRPVLDAVFDLFALAAIERERGWYLEHNRFSAVRSKAITRGVNRLLVQLRPHARDLVDAFGIPDAVLGAPIAMDVPA
jgi:acyl-CoA oxidase